MNTPANNTEANAVIDAPAAVTQMTGTESTVQFNIPEHAPEIDTTLYFTAVLVNSKNNVQHEIVNIIAEDEVAARKQMDARFPPEERKLPFGRRMLTGGNMIIGGQDSLQIFRQKSVISPAEFVSSAKSNRIPAR